MPNAEFVRAENFKEGMRRLAGRVTVVTTAETPDAVISTIRRQLPHAAVPSAGLP